MFLDDIKSTAAKRQSASKRSIMSVAMPGVPGQTVNLYSSI